MTPAHTQFYRDKARGKLLGVCAGIADYTGLDVLWVRIATLILLSCSAGMVWMVYLAIGLLAEDKPRALRSEPADQQRFWQGVRQSPARAGREVRSQLREIDRRLAAVEAYYVSSNPRLAAEIESLR